MNAVSRAIHQDRDREQTRRHIHESRELKRQLLARVINRAPNDDLRRQAQFYLDRLNAGRDDG